MNRKLPLLLVLSLLLVSLAIPALAGTTADAADVSEYPYIEMYQSPVFFICDPQSPQDDAAVKELETLWTYEYTTGKTGVFKAMERTESQPGTAEAPPADGTVVYQQPQIDGSPAADAIAALRCFWKSLYLAPGAQEGIAQTFVVPRTGVIEIDPTTIVRNYGNDDKEENLNKSIEVAVYLNETKVWPEGNDWAAVSRDSASMNKLAVEKISALSVEKGDRLRFVVNTGEGSNWNDNTQWPVTVKLYSQKDAAPDMTKYSLKSAYTSPARFISDSQSDKDDPALKDLGTVWTYEYGNSQSGLFTDMVRTDKLPGTEAAPPADGTVVYQQPQVDGVPAADAIAALRCFWGSLYLSPGTQWDIAQTLIVPEDGILNVDPTTIVRNYGNDDADVKGTIEVAVYLNRTKIWPAGKDWATISRDSTVLNKLDMEALTGLSVKEGDRLRFVVNAGQAATVNWGDNTQWPVAAKLYTEIEEGDDSAPGTNSSETESSSGETESSSPEIGSSAPVRSDPDVNPETGASAPYTAALLVFAAGGAVITVLSLRKRQRG